MRAESSTTSTETGSATKFPLDEFSIETGPIGLHELELRVHAEERLGMADEEE
jgi:hypothetical protein